MKIVFLYAGQGSQRVGMGKDLYNTYETFRDVYDNISINFDLKVLCFEGPMDKLSTTRYTQPCMVAYAVGVTRLLEQEGIRPDMVAGLSLGEYSALYSSGVFTADQVIDLVYYRGRAMEEAAKGCDAGMTAVMFCDRAVLEEACRTAEAEGLGVVSIANYNCSTQLVISGMARAVNRAAEIALQNGAKKCIPLQVSGPFHTSLMKTAGDALAKRFVSEHFGDMKIPVVFNTTASVIGTDESISELLVRQVQSSVYFQDSIEYMERMGVDTIVEIGPGDTLSRLVKKISKNIICYSIDSTQTYVDTLRHLKGVN